MTDRERDAEDLARYIMVGRLAVDDHHPLGVESSMVARFVAKARAFLSSGPDAATGEEKRGPCRECDGSGACQHPHNGDWRRCFKCKGSGMETP